MEYTLRVLGFRVWGMEYTLSYQNLLVCRVCASSVLGFTIGT